MDVKDEIMRRVETLPPDAQRELLAQLEAKEGARIKGDTLADLQPFIGILDDQSAQEMIAAIESGCENIDPERETLVFGES
jgi:hypothetical protein